MESIDNRVNENRPPVSYRASFRIMGDNLDPVEITELLGIQPSHSHKKGDSKKGTVIEFPPYPSGLWSIDSSAIPKTKELEEHLSYLLNILEPLKQQIEMLKKEGFKMDFFCGYFSEIDSGIMLSSNVLKRLGELEVDLDVDIWI
jgi:hypothetical protein